MAQRVLAVLGAVVIVLVAVVVRNAMDDEGSNGLDTGGGGDGDVVLMCANDADFAAACQDRRGITFIVEPAAATAERLRTGALPAGVDGWITSGGWIEVVQERASSSIGDVRPIATSDIIVATDERRTDAISTLCAAQRIFACLGDHAGESWSSLGAGDASWGALKVGFPPPDDPIGLAALAAAAAGFLGNDDFAANDFEPSGLRGWLATLLEPSGPQGQRNPVGVLVTQVGRFSAVADLRSSLGLPLRTGVIEPDPAVAVVAVAASFPGGDELPDLRFVEESFESLQWQLMPPDAEVPSTLKPGVMAALHTLWTEVTR